MTKNRDLREALLERHPRRKRGRGIPLAIWFVLILLVLGGGAAALHAVLYAPPSPESAELLSGSRESASPTGNSPTLDPRDLGLGSGESPEPAALRNSASNDAGMTPPSETGESTLALASHRNPPEQPAASDGPARDVAPDAGTPAKPLSRLQEADALVRAGQYDRARDLVEDALAETTAPAPRAEILYRLGLIARYQQRESDAQNRWSDAYNSAPDSVGGRLAAVALADTAFARNVTPSPSDDQYARWELIRDTYSNAFGRDGAPFLPEETRERIVRNLHLLNDRLVFSPAPVSGAVYHTVEGGEYLSRIAGHYGVHYLSIAVINQIDPNRVRVGRMLKILKGTCEIIVDRSDLTLTWYLDGRFVRQYPCCIGPDEKTPAGTYAIINQEEKPAWPDPQTGEIYPYGHPKNILGTHWLGLEGGDTSGLGIHGTTVPESIPGRTSAGCIRLHNDHVRELYGFARLGTTVIIRD